LVVLLALVLSRLATPSAPPAAPTQTTVPLLAHGQITPARQARVGTQGGGVIEQLAVKVGAQVSDGTPLAWVRGPSGTEIVSAPFSGTITNVFVHAGDTLAPAATIAVLADLQSLQVETNDVDEFLIAHVAVGQAVDVRVDALDNEAISGRVTSVAMLPQPSSTGNNATDYPVMISLDRVPSDVRAGMSVRATFLT
jgi:multidrug resistance efflux pump